MSDEKVANEERLSAVHVCEECGAVSAPNELSDDVSVTGVVQCRICGHIGPLDIQIISSAR